MLADRGLVGIKARLESGKRQQKQISAILKWLAKLNAEILGLGLEEERS